MYREAVSWLSCAVGPVCAGQGSEWPGLSSHTWYVKGKVNLPPFVYKGSGGGGETTAPLVGFLQMYGRDSEQARGAQRRPLSHQIATHWRALKYDAAFAKYWYWKPL